MHTEGVCLQIKKQIKKGVLLTVTWMQYSENKEPLWFFFSFLHICNQMCGTPVCTAI